MDPESAAAEIRRHLSAAPPKVFAAFADPMMVSRWLTPSADVKLDVLEFDFREGGKYRFAYHVPGGQIMTVTGVYRLIRRPSEIIFSWVIEPPDDHAGIRSEVKVRIAPHGAGSVLHILHQQLAAPGAVERHRAGWGGAIQQLGALLDQTEQTK
jgi:uncharacterized protein YndB with AHSA1/START domain